MRLDKAYGTQERETAVGTDKRVALVTGGTRGIGHAVAEQFARGGSAVFLCSRSESDVSRVVEELTGQGMDAAGCVGDVGDSAAADRVVQAALRSYGRIDVLVNNAGRSGGGPTKYIADDLWSAVMKTNADSVFYMSRATLQHGGMVERGHGRIVNIASTAGKQGVVLGAPYSASKHAVIGFTKALALELAQTGVTVNAVCPGYVETPMAEEVRSNYARLWDMTTDEVLEQFNAKIPIGRYVRPDEVAAMVGYLASDAASSVTAQAMNVCGGLGRF